VYCVMANQNDAGAEWSCTNNITWYKYGQSRTYNEYEYVIENNDSQDYTYYYYQVTNNWPSTFFAHAPVFVQVAGRSNLLLHVDYKMVTHE